MLILILFSEDFSYIYSVINFVLILLLIGIEIILRFFFHSLFCKLKIQTIEKKKYINLK